MNRIEKLGTDPLFRQRIAQIEAMEQNRKFCRHGLTHLLDTARILWIDILENRLEFSKDVVYATALLHDIGRAQDAEQHQFAGIDDIYTILQHCDFSASEIEEIVSAISAHRNTIANDDSSLSALLYRADKRSRLCFTCPAADECYWPEERRIKTITI